MKGPHSSETNDLQNYVETVKPCVRSAGVMGIVNAVTGVLNVYVIIICIDSESCSFLHRLVWTWVL